MEVNRIGRYVWSVHEGRGIAINQLFNCVGEKRGSMAFQNCEFFAWVVSRALLLFFFFLRLLSYLSFALVGMTPLVEGQQSNRREPKHLDPRLPFRNIFFASFLLVDRILTLPG